MHQISTERGLNRREIRGIVQTNGAIILSFGQTRTPNFRPKNEDDRPGIHSQFQNRRNRVVLLRPSRENNKGSVFPTNLPTFISNLLKAK